MRDAIGPTLIVDTRASMDTIVQYADSDSLDRLRLRLANWHAREADAYRGRSFTWRRA